jgi:hypothetical protein
VERLRAAESLTAAPTCSRKLAQVVRKTFARIRQEQRRQEQANASPEVENVVKVLSISKRTAGAP